MLPLQHGSVKEARYVFSLYKFSMTEYSDRMLQFHLKCHAHGGTSCGPYHSQMDRRAIWHRQIAKDKRTCVSWKNGKIQEIKNFRRHETMYYSGPKLGLGQ